MGGLVPIKLMQTVTVPGFGLFNPGEVAGFPPEVAARLVEIGAAERAPEAERKGLERLLQAAEDGSPELREAAARVRAYAPAREGLLAEERDLADKLQDAEREELNAFLRDPGDRKALRAKAEAAEGVRAVLAEVRRKLMMLHDGEAEATEALAAGLRVHVEAESARIFEAELQLAAEKVAGLVEELLGAYGAARGIRRHLEALRETRRLALRYLGDDGAALPTDDAESRLVFEMTGGWPQGPQQFVGGDGLRVDSLVKAAMRRNQR